MALTTILELLKTLTTPGGEEKKTGWYDDGTRIYPVVYTASEAGATTLNPTTVLANVAAGDAADGTIDYFVNTQSKAYSAFQLLLTPDTGTITVSFYGTLNDSATPSGIASGEWVDIGLDLFGAATFTANAILSDSEGESRAFAWIRVRVVTGTPSADTAYKIYSRQS